MTIAQIGNLAGYTAALVSHRFGSKERLLIETIEHIGKGFVSNHLQPSDSNTAASESIDRFVVGYLADAKRESSGLRALYSIMGESIGGVREAIPALSNLNEKMHHQLSLWISEGINNGEFHATTNADDAATLILSVLRGFMFQEILEISPSRLAAPIHEGRL